MQEEEKVALTKEVFLQEFVLNALEGGSSTNGNSLALDAIAAWTAIKTAMVSDSI